MNFVPDELLAFCAVAAVFSVSPGPDTLLVVNRALSHGRRVALLTALGSASGLVAWGLLSALGIAAIFNTSATAFAILKLLGAGYLVFLGVQAMRRAQMSAQMSAREPARSRADDPEHPPAAPRWPFRQGLLTNLINAKAGVFFVAILPQFITPRDDALTATMVFALTDAFASLLALSCYTALALAAAGALRRPAARRAIDRVTGGVFVLLGARLALQSR
jgi:threonine/homoserine/homoserine lactone efflux protein